MPEEAITLGLGDGEGLLPHPAAYARRSARITTKRANLKPCLPASCAQRTADSCERAGSS
jgi:hypothetical protein